MKLINNYINEKLVLNKTTKIIKSDPNNPDTWKVGDILAGTAGYSMRLPEFYKIVKRTAKSFTVQQMKGKIVSGHRNGQWEEIADEDAPLIEKTYTGRIRKYGGVQVNGVNVHLWDGKPLYGDDMD